MFKTLVVAMSLVVSAQALAMSPIRDESDWAALSDSEKATLAAVAIIPKLEALLSVTSKDSSSVFALYEKTKCSSTPKSVDINEGSRNFKVVLRCGSYRPVVRGYIGDGDTGLTEISVRASN